MRRGLDPRLTDQALCGWYKWVGSRKVLLMDRFPIRLTVLDDLVASINDKSYYHSLLSIEIERDLSKFDLSTLQVLEDKLSSLLNECHRLQIVKVSGFMEESYDDLDRVLCSALNNGLAGNTLVKIAWLTFFYPSLDPLINLLSNHVSTLKDLTIYDCSETLLSMHDLFTFLHEKSVDLTRLCLSGIDSLSMDMLFQHLSSSGMCLEALEIGSRSKPCVDLYITSELLLSIGRACPSLRTLRLKTALLLEQAELLAASQLYELCPNMLTLDCADRRHAISITADDDKREVWFSTDLVLYMEDSREWIQCLCYVLERSHYTLMTSNTNFFWNFTSETDLWDILKSKLSSYLTSIEGIMSDATLVRDLKDLPHLMELNAIAGDNKFSDVSLDAITEHGHGLKTLYFHKFANVNSQCSFTDEKIRNVIQVCPLLEALKIPNAGRDSVVAMKNHGRLREVYLENVKVDLLEMKALLGVKEEKEKKTWSRLKKGTIKGRNYVFNYVVKSKTWVLKK
eukprot:scaffold398_cov177-Ochromonas_danica.AAC.38